MQPVCTIIFNLLIQERECSFVNHCTQTHPDSASFQPAQCLQGEVHKFAPSVMEWISIATETFPSASFNQDAPDGDRIKFVLDKIGEASTLYEAQLGWSLALRRCMFE